MAATQTNGPIGLMANAEGGKERGAESSPHALYKALIGATHIKAEAFRNDHRLAIANVSASQSSLILYGVDPEDTMIKPNGRCKILKKNILK